jgi:hypothetical protein
MECRESFRFNALSNMKYQTKDFRLFHNIHVFARYLILAYDRHHLLLRSLIMPRGVIYYRCFLLLSILFLAVGEGLKALYSA